MPAAHDALSARLCQLAGFQAVFMGGFGALASRYALPDFGLAALGELSPIARDMIQSISVPLLVDADNGYGDVKNVTRTVQVYERMGAGGIILEDQAHPKRCGHMAGTRTVVPLAVAEDNLKAALDARRDDGLFIVARTDARNALGLEAALERGHRFAEIGADALFIEAPDSEEELALIGSTFSTPLLVNNPEQGRGPYLPQARLVELGYSIIVVPTAILWRVVMATRQALEDLRRDTLRAPPGFPTIEELAGLMGADDWIAIDQRFDGRNDGAGGTAGN